MSALLWQQPLPALPKRGGLRMALVSYFDESGKFHGKTGYICLCGYLSDEVGWKKYNDTWNHLLAKHRIRGAMS